MLWDKILKKNQEKDKENRNQKNEDHIEYKK